MENTLLSSRNHCNKSPQTGIGYLSGCNLIEFMEVHDRFSVTYDFGTGALKGKVDDSVMSIPKIFVTQLTSFVVR